MTDQAYDTLVVLGPTASGKTRLGVALAALLDGEIISADSRQVYRGLDIGSGKDLDVYAVDGREVDRHLIDIVGLGEEFSVFDFQERFGAAHTDITRRGRLPIVAGGTGLYIEAVIEGYAMDRVGRDAELRKELATLDEQQLADYLRSVRPSLHNTTDLADRERTTRAIEIALHSERTGPGETPRIRPYTIGISWNAEALRERIGRRLRERLDAGLVEEVQNLLGAGVTPERLRLLGLEYRYVTDYLEGRIRNRNDLYQKLNAAIANFAKRQRTWFRRMERRGASIHWIDGCDVDRAFALARAAFPGRVRE